METKEEKQRRLDKLQNDMNEVCMQNHPTEVLEALAKAYKSIGASYRNTVAGDVGIAICNVAKIVEALGDLYPC